MFLINITNHPFTEWGPLQREAALELGFGSVKDLTFPNVDPYCNEKDLVQLALNALESFESMKGCAAVVQGEFTLTWTIISLFKRYNIPCFSATSERVVVETLQEDGTTKRESVFRFVRFREYKTV
jgi:hypothetical protein